MFEKCDFQLTPTSYTLPIGFSKVKQINLTYRPSRETFGPEESKGAITTQVYNAIANSQFEEQ